MTIKEFQERYHDYSTEDQMEAMSDAMKLRVLDDNGKEVKIVPMKFGNSYCLMVDTAAGVVKELGLND